MAEVQPIDPRETLKGLQKSINVDTATRVLQQTKQNYIIQGFSLSRLKTQLYQVRPQTEDDPLQSSKDPAPGQFGLPIFTNLEFEFGNYQDLNTGEVIQYNPVRLDTVLMTVSMTKNVITTPIQGRSGTVKEFVNDGDFEIDVKGVLIGEGQREYPEQQMEELIRILTVPDTLEITSEYLTNFGVISPGGVEGISQVVITDFNFPQREGFRNAQLFQFKMLSDTPIELTI